eukprot:TRINITY_DN3724_c0_g1_i2.p1 TRINITY_DN3724_c0_g1~~TRINITY_DN3724_c0_g1_i2.p1  ORF type:complete len:107 (+),score=20.34 TRINITY_DN3724_c0_g1_i2:154-474(+)
MEGKLVKSVAIQSGHYFHVSSSPSGFIFLLGSNPKVISPNGETLELLPTYRQDKVVKFPEAERYIQNYGYDSETPLFLAFTKDKNITYIDPYGGYIGAYHRDLSTI